MATILCQTMAPEPPSSEPTPTRLAEPEDTSDLILYQVPSIEVAMRDAPDWDTLPALVVHNPTPEIRYLQRQMAQCYDDVVRLARYVDTEHRNVDAVKDNYDVVRRNYSALRTLCENRLKVFEDQLHHFTSSVQTASQHFGETIHGIIARHTTDAAARAEAVKFLQEVARQHEKALEALQSEQKTQRDFNSRVESWAQNKEAQIDDLLQKRFVTTEQLNQKVQAQFDELRSFTARALQDAGLPHDRRSVEAQIRRVTTTDGGSSSVKSPPTSSAPLDPLSNEALLQQLARQTSEAAHAQYIGTQKSTTPYASGALPVPDIPGNGGPPRPRTGAAAPGDQDSDPGDSDDGSNRSPPRGPGRGGSGGPPRPPRGSGGYDDSGSELPDDPTTRALMRLFSKSISRPVVTTPVQLHKPPTYDGKDLAKFKAWWISVEDYLETYTTSFTSDAMKINWVGSLLLDKARIWHQQRRNTLKKLGAVATWPGYVAGIQARFNDPAEAHRKSKKLKALSYRNDIVQYLTEVQELNSVVRWSGTTFQDHITQVLPDDIIRLVYSQRGGVPENDAEFISAVQEAGLVYEKMLANPGLQKESGKPGSTSGHSKSGKRQPERPQSDLKSSSKRPDNKWPNIKAALQDIDQKDIDQRKQERTDCWRCGRNGHKTLACHASKDMNGKDIPRPAKVSGTSTDRPKEKNKKRSKEPEEDEKDETPVKRPKVDALNVNFQEDSARIFELPDDDSDNCSEMDFR